MENEPPAQEPERSYFSSLKYHISASIVLFVFSLTVGYFFAEATGSELLRALQSTYGPLFLEFNPAIMLAVIFANNAFKTFIAMLAGLVFGIVPAFFILANGFVIGAVVFEAIRAKGVLFTLTALLPHGLIEVPTVLFGSAIGLKLGIEAFRKVKGRGKVLFELHKGLKVFLHRLLPLLFIAAVIETFVTPYLIAKLL